MRRTILMAGTAAALLAGTALAVAQQEPLPMPPRNEPIQTAPAPQAPPAVDQRGNVREPGTVGQGRPVLQPGGHSPTEPPEGQSPSDPNRPNQ